MNFSSVVRKLNEFAPTHLAQSWDNVGVLIEPPKMRLISKLLLTNDLTLAVMDEAEEKKVDMILSYHPPIFKPLKTITTAHWKENIVGRCLSNGISVFSPHTSYDAVKGGVNDWLISAFGTGRVTPIFPHFSTSEMNHKIDFENFQNQENMSKFKDILTNNYNSKFRFLNDGTESSSTLLCSEESLPPIISTLLQCKKDATFSVTKLEKIPELDVGDGRECSLDHPITVENAVGLVKKHLKLDKVRLALKHAGTIEDLVKTVAVCAGSGASVLRKTKADLVLTGELSHHDVLEMVHRGTNVILVDHSNSERGFIGSWLLAHLTNSLGPDVQVVVSSEDSDPLKIV